MQFHTDGLDQLQENLNTAADAIALRLGEAVMEEIDAGWSALSPSEPGEAPAIVSGTLAGSITLEATAPGEVRVGSGAAYAPMLEFGTSELEARPWLRPAVERVRSQIVHIVRGVLWTR